MLLALDLGSSTGWARWSPSMASPVYGVEKFTDKNHDHRAYDFRCWLDQKIKAQGITTIYVEMFLSAASGKKMGAGNETWTPYQHLCVGELAVANNAVIKRVHMSTWRKHFLSVGTAPRSIRNGRKWLKEQAVKRCNLLGWKTRCDDDAEALGILDYAKAMENPRLAALTTDLFAQVQERRI